MTADLFIDAFAGMLEGEEVLPRIWRGTLPWRKPYEEVLAAVQAEWRRSKDPHKPKAPPLPPAFQDGRARPAQLLPGTPGAFGAVNGSTGKPITNPEEWVYWLLRSGRGFGKTDSGANAIIEWAKAGITPLLVAGRTAADVRDTMVEFGPSSILRVAPHDFMPDYEPSKRRLVFPNGVEVATRSADEPDGFRGVQFVRAWLDELAAWNYLGYAWEQITLVMRVRRRQRVQVVITTTPRNVKVVKDLTHDPRTALTVRPSHDNLANLADDYLQVIADLEGTRAGRQEVYAEIVEDAEGALWTQAQIDEDRITVAEFQRRLREDELRLVRLDVGVDPPGGERTECGLIAVSKGNDRRAYVVQDASTAGGAEVWPPALAAVYDAWHADKAVAETNYGGDMVAAVIKASGGKAGERRINIQTVTASRGKAVRAAPVSALYRRHLVSHVGNFPQLEREMTSWVPDDGQLSPNRMDALVWGLTELYDLGTEKRERKAHLPPGAERLMPMGAKPAEGERPGHPRKLKEAPVLPLAAAAAPRRR